MDIEKMLVHLGDAQRISSREEMIKRDRKKLRGGFLQKRGEQASQMGRVSPESGMAHTKALVASADGASDASLVLPACGFGVRFTEKNHGHRRMCLRDTHDPELWKNRASGSMEIEASAYYSLRRVYAARMLLFGMADHNTGSLLLCRASVTIHVALYDMLTQFLFPMAVTACICFALLSSIRVSARLPLSSCASCGAVSGCC